MTQYYVRSINLSVLRPEYVPERIPHREEDLKKLANACLRKKLVFITSSAGLGKTLLLKKIYISSILPEHYLSIYLVVRRFIKPEHIIRELYCKVNEYEYSHRVSLKDAISSIKSVLDDEGYSHILLLLDDCRDKGDLIRAIRSLEILDSNNISVKAIISCSAEFRNIYDISKVKDYYLMKLTRYKASELKDILKYRLLCTNMSQSLIEENTFRELAISLYRYFRSNVTLGLIVLYSACLMMLEGKILCITPSLVHNLLKDITLRQYKALSSL
ncbi:MAG: hypothetical protein DRJ52_00050 [Thermoprotei archaeon]|nr:MAG: hypothetical protein DRJ52_00050 [Thermoprotei archaeon]RLE98879.1 MAG: hypothetical protein DRJ63_06935 [Thermoprotei archaeon]